ncbi:putative NUDIX hydrolase [uncultured delta proteobacterium]|uniref:Putative NUDIX hydrolase n=1 Tax=uncultured delta proteobacterium TaxID=34034 RepID=A0A212K4X3_9DELT|nr:putative NUDIX hydrolase [uncultured delta proteobacterium]
MAEKEEKKGSVIVVFAFIRQGGELLLVERAFPPYRGVRTIPGGHKKRGEELKEACCREMAEETGLRIDSLRFAGVMQVHRPDNPGPEYLCAYFVADAFSGTVTESAEGSLAWTKMAAIHDDPGTHPALRALLPFIERGEFPFTAEAHTDGEGRGVYTVTGPGKDAAPVSKHYG